VNELQLLEPDIFKRKGNMCRKKAKGKVNWINTITLRNI